MSDDKHILVRKSEYDDVYVESHESVYTPDLKPRNQAHSLGKRWFATAFVVVLLASSTGITYGSISGTGSFFSDLENSTGNQLVAGILDFIGAESPQVYNIEEDAPPIEVPVIITPELGSVEMNYRVTTEYTGGSATLCNALMVSTVSPFAFSGGLLSLDGYAFINASLTLSLTLPDSAGLADGDQCMFDVVFKSWNKLVPEATGYQDEERVQVTVTFNAGETEETGDTPNADPFDIVLNEFLPNPDDAANGLDFGNDSSSMPDGEWIEIYNKGPVAQDVVGWFMTDASGGVGNTHAVISGSNTNTGSTIIAPGGWLVVYMNKPSLNNTGDEIYLYSPDNTQRDFVSYDDPSDGCTLEPTPGADNTDDSPTGTPDNGPNADCAENQVAPNKSYARIPDGTGPWVDPIPTPGAPNILEESVQVEPTAPPPPIEKPAVDVPADLPAEALAEEGEPPAVVEEPPVVE